MKILFLVAFASFDVVFGHTFIGAPQKREHVAAWQKFKKDFGKSYEDLKTDLHRMELFINNYIDIQEHNKRHSRGEVSYKLGLNHFGDLAAHEFLSYATCFHPKHLRQMSHKTSKVFVDRYGDPPNSFDWREKNAVTSVKDQGNCGCCWAFASLQFGSISQFRNFLAEKTGINIGNFNDKYDGLISLWTYKYDGLKRDGVAAIETPYFLSSTQLVDLSPQNLVDCDKNSDGCEGGMPNYAFEYVKQNGINTEADYHYEQVDGTCRAKKEKAVAKIIDYNMYYRNITEEQMLKLLSEGPLAVAIATNEKFHHYSEGVFSDCYGDYTHAVTIVGYGTTPEGKDYWILKNSWAPSWGDQGYMLYARGVKECDLTYYVTSIRL